MIEQGLVLLVQAGLGSPPIAPGGFAVQLPKDQISAAAPKAWTYRSIVSQPSHYLKDQDGFTSLEIRIDAHGFTMADAIVLARAIDGILRGNYSGVLSDPDHTVVHGIFRQPAYVDGFSDANRSFVRTQEYVVDYEQI